MRKIVIVAAICCTCFVFRALVFVVMTLFYNEQPYWILLPYLAFSEIVPLGGLLYVFDSHAANTEDFIQSVTGGTFYPSTVTVGAPKKRLLDEQHQQQQYHQQQQQQAVATTINDEEEVDEESSPQPPKTEGEGEDNES